MNGFIERGDFGNDAGLSDMIGRFTAKNPIACNPMIMNSLAAVAALMLLVSPMAGEPSLKLSAIPYPLFMENQGTASSGGGIDTLDMTSRERCDLFISPDGGFSTDKSPRLLFKPAGPFILTAKIRPEFQGKWDAGVLLVFNDPKHFAKFCYERDFQGNSRIVSVVCNDTADDCNSALEPAGAVFFRVIGASRGDTFTFYVSKEGKTWFPVRSFRMQKTDNIRLGFSAQSPEGEGCTAHFTNIRIEAREPKDFWAGD